MLKMNMYYQWLIITPKLWMSMTLQYLQMLEDN